MKSAGPSLCQAIRNWRRPLAGAFLLTFIAGVFATVYQGRSFVGKTIFQVYHLSGSADLLSLLNSPQIVKDAAKAKKLPEHWNLTETEIAKKLRGMVEISVEKGSEVISVEVYGDDPVEAADLANAVRDCFEERLRSAERERLAQRERRRDNKIKLLEKEVEISGMELEAGTREKLRAELREICNFHWHISEDLMDGKILLGPNDETLSHFVAKMKADRVEFKRLLDVGFGRRHPRVVNVKRRIEESYGILTPTLENSRVPHPSMLSGLTPNEVSSEAATAYFNRLKAEHAGKLQLLEELKYSVIADHVTTYLPRHPMEVLKIAKPGTMRVWRVPPVPHLAGICGAAVAAGVLLFRKGVRSDGRKDERALGSNP